MSDDQTQKIAESESAVAYGRHAHFDMDEAFCARMSAAIAAGLENAPTGVVTAPGTKSPIYEQSPSRCPHRSALWSMLKV
jgi:hypothetical protein